MAETTYTITIEGTGTAFECAADDTILRAGLRAGLGFPYDCNVGACGDCKVSLVSGGLVSNWPEAPGLSARDLRKGRLLGCQCRPSADTTIRVRLDAGMIPPVRPRKAPVRLVSWRSITHDMMQFDFKGEGPADFVPGQYALLDLPGVGAPRAYSMANLPNDEGLWSFIIRRVPGGKATSCLFDAGDRDMAASLDGPFGNAYLREHDPRDIVCIAGGSGLAPMVSIVRGVGVRNGMRNRIRLYYGARTRADVYDRALMEGAGLPAGRLQQTIALSEGAAPDGLKTGFIHEHVQQALEGQMKDFVYYVAGPPPMTEAVTKMLVVDNQVDIASVHYDRFF